MSTWMEVARAHLVGGFKFLRLPVDDPGPRFRDRHRGGRRRAGSKKRILRCGLRHLAAFLAIGVISRCALAPLWTGRG